MALTPYRRKRDFSRTPEPPGGTRTPPPGRLYIIQKHAARALHYDFRLELGGVLKSWAVPKGPSLDPAQKRLAKHVEDHPLEYGGFEGIIPAGEYGGGTVMLWDRGEWEPEGDPDRDYRRGRLSFRLRGEKLQGAWSLARMGREGDDWLLIKRHDEVAVDGDDGQFLEAHPRSVLSGRDLEEIAADRDLVWKGGEAVSEAADFRSEAGELPGAVAKQQPERLAPQLATLAGQVPAGNDWLHEIKFDGYRLLAFLNGGRVQLKTRNGHDWTERFPAIVDSLARLPVQQAIFDGEIVVLDGRGISHFQALQNLLREGGTQRLVYYLFDTPFCDGFDLTRSPLAERKNLLRRVLSPPDPEKSLVRFSDHIAGEGEAVYRNACRLGLEGVVSKRADSSYIQKRSASWLKIKCQQRQEFVIGGYTAPGGARSGFGALLVGYFDRDGQLVYAGKVGTGFDDATLAALERDLRLRRVDRSPFQAPPKEAQSRGVTWVRPELVAEIAFTEWTGDGRLRHPSFKGLREDKGARQVTRETAPASLGEAIGGKLADAAREGRGMNIAGVQISNPEKVMYPEQGVTKGDLAAYYCRVGDLILPFVTGRPLTVVRCPQGRQRKCFYQKHLNESVPAPVRGVKVREKEGEQLYLVIDDLPGLITLVQLGVLEFHPWGAREDRLDRPDTLIFDLDPGPGVPWGEVIETAHRLHRRLAELDLQSFVKTTGGKGLHVVVPLVRRGDWGEGKAFTRAVAEETAGRFPGRYVTTMSKARRQGKVFIDFFRNDRGATSVAPYSTRARPGATVSTPLAWEELGTVLTPDGFTIENLPPRLERLQADPWRDFFAVRQSITRSHHRELGF